LKVYFIKGTSYRCLCLY